jgi:hypothetical protein
MDYFLILIAVGAMWLIGWFAYLVGRSTSDRAYASALATERAKVRRLTRDLETAHEQTAMVRRASRGGAA